MASDIKKLLEKYWAGETTVQEEQLLKQHFNESHNISPAGQYFKSLNEFKELKPNLSFKQRNYSRFTVAASIAIGIIVAVFVFRDAQSKDAFLVEDPQEALEITRNALMMVSSSLNEGGNYSLQLKKFDDTKQILKNKEIKDEKID